MLTTTPWSHGLGALLTLALLAGCGPASSDNAPTLDPRAAVGGPDYRPEARGMGRGDSTLPTLASSPAPLVLNLAPVPDVKEELAPMPAQLVLPQWIAQALESPKVPVRLRALDRWAQQGPQAPLDPLVVALDDADAEVRERAMAIIGQYWAITQEAAPAAAP